jgi:hypothetical protein
MPSPRALLLASAALCAVVIVGLLFTRPRPPTSGTTPPGATTAPTPTTPLNVVSSAFSAIVEAPGADTIRWGPAGGSALLWQPVVDGRATLTGLLPNTRYVGTAGGETVTFSTGAVPATVSATVRGGALQLDGAPFFPLMAWQECPDRWEPDLADGLTLFAGNPCTNLASLLTAVAGRAVVAGTAQDVSGTTGPALIGWFYPDEADARGYTGRTLASAGPGARFLTITSHFFPLAAPLPRGRGMYTGLIQRADVVGFDLYPLQELCRPELLPWVYDAQVWLRELARPRATFQWIEDRELNCPDATDAVTPATIRVESWLAIAGGATGLGFFPGNREDAVRHAIRGVAHRVRQLLPALVRQPVPIGVSPAAPDVRAAGRLFGGAFYVIAVNAGAQASSVTLTADELADRRLVSAGRPDLLRAHDGTLPVTLPGMSVRIYVAPPQS